MSKQEQFLMTEGTLLTENGQLEQAGYQHQLVREYNRAHIKASKLRIKEWDYYCVCSGDTVLALTIADNGYMGLDSVTLIDLNLRWQYTKSFMRAFPMGKTGLPSTSKQGDVAVEKKGYSLRFHNDGKTRVLDARVDRFFDGKPLTAHIELSDEPEHSMVIATPFPGKPKAFYYNQKINCLQANGQVTFDGQTHEFSKENSMAVLDWGRGVWTYKNTWYWSSLSGRVDGVPFGFNLGYGFGDTSAATENMLFVDGKAHKLHQVVFQIPTKEDGSDDFLKPWSVKDNEGKLELVFTPVLDRAALTSVGIIESDQHQVFGYFDGIARTDTQELKLVHMLGFAEKVRNKW
ncbi:MAG: DUF2804 domain-containing protein [Eubacteriales bacterium]|nr:DUF2804 domain-containing protein [Eubacteriales bacterium]